MGLETVTYLPELNQSNPVGSTDPKSQGDDHLRIIKKSLLNTFGAFVGTAATPKSVTLTEDEINDCLQKAIDNTLLGRLVTDDSTTTRAGLNVPNGIAPTSPAQGDIWATATDLIARINGVSLSLISQAGAAVTKHKTSDETRNSNTFSDDAQMAGWSVDAASYYTIKGFLRVQAGNANPDVKFRFETSQTFVSSYTGYVGGAEDRAIDGDSAITPTGVQFPLGAANGQGIMLHGNFRTHATESGTVDFQWAQVNTDGGNLTTMFDGSWITIEKL